MKAVIRFLPVLLVGVSFLLAQTGGWLAAIWPSVVALATVIVVSRVITGLVAGGVAGCLILAGGNPFVAFVSFFQDHLIPALQSPWNIGAILFTFMLGGFSALIEAGGSLQSMVNPASGKTGRKRFQATAYGIGLVCFFDGLANSMLVGRVFRPLADKLGVSRAKLAYLVDSTSSAVTCVAFVSTWIAFQLSMIEKGHELAGRSDGLNPYGLFFQSIPYNFYCWFTLLLLAVVIATDLNIGPMKTFEEKARKGDRGGAGRGVADGEAGRVEGGGMVILLVRFWLPLLTLIGSLLLGLYVSGMHELSAAGGASLPGGWQNVAAAFGAADAALVLVCSSALASLVAWLVFPRGAGKRDEKRSEETASETYLRGVQSLFTPILILLSAWILSSTLNALGAGGAIAGLMEGHVSLEFLASLVFLVGALISFSTGTSWGTMAILMPLAIVVGFDLGDGSGLSREVIDRHLAVVVAAVFSGAVFGDHCSPISDTTLVSSIASGVEPKDHVRTQLPYAILSALLAILAGFLPAGILLVPWVGLVPVVVAGIFILMRGRE